MRRTNLVITTVSCIFFLLAGCQQQAEVMPSEESHIKLLSQKKLGDKYRLELEITPPSEDTKKFTDAFTVNMEDGDTLEVTCQGLYKKAEQAAAQEGRPKIEFESLVHDFGKVGPGRKLNGEFKFTNTGDAPLKITKVERCCGVIAKVDKEQLAPGESGVLKVLYTSSRMANKIMKRLYVNSNDKNMPRATLTIKAETVLRVDYEPKRLKLLLKDENAGCPEITLTSTDNQPFSITKFESTGGFITADIDISVEATEFVLQPKVDMEKLHKNPSGRINIGLAFHQPDTPENVSIYFKAVSRFSTMPERLLFVYDKSMETLKKSVSVLNNYGEDFEIESTSSKEGYVKVVGQKTVRERHWLLLEITTPGEHTKGFTDTFTINLKDGETLEVPCRGIYRSAKQAKATQEPAPASPDASVTEDKTTASEPNGPAPKITFENVVHDFGEVSGGKTSTAEFKFTNTGDGPLKITEVKKCCGVVTKLDKTEYEPGESGVLKVNYRASHSASTLNRQIHVISNDRQNPKLPLTLKAKVVPKVAYEPKRLELRLKGEDAGCPEITLRSLDKQMFSIKSFTSSRNCVTADVDPSVEATNFVLQPVVDFEKLQGLSVGLIRIALTHPECDTVTISYRVVTKFNITPRSLIVVNPVAQKPVAKKLYIQSNYNEDFEVDSVSSENGFVSLLSRQSTDKGYQLELEITPPAKNNASRFMDTLYVNIKDGEKLEIKCYGLNSRQRVSSVQQ